jgi:hypothetical protein
MSNGFASLAVLNTNLSAASGLVTWLLLDFRFRPKTRKAINPIGLATGERGCGKSPVTNYAYFGVVYFSFSASLCETHAFLM